MAFHLSPDERAKAMHVYQFSDDIGRSSIALTLLLLDDGLTPKQVGQVTYASLKEVLGVLERFGKEGIDGVLR